MTIPEITGFHIFICVLLFVFIPHLSASKKDLSFVVGWNRKQRIAIWHYPGASLI